MRDNMEQVRVLVDISSDGGYEKLASRLRELGEEFELPLQVLKLTHENLDQLGVLMDRVWEDVPVILPLVVSPNHSITYNCLSKIRDSGVSAERVNLIDFDAHGDFGESPLINAGSWLYRAIDDGLVEAANILLMGHFYPKHEEVRKMEAAGIRVVSADDLNMAKEPPFGSLNGDYTWISIDMDCLRNWYTGVPHGRQGVHYHRFMKVLLNSLECGRIVGLDFVEWRSPPMGMGVLVGVLTTIVGKYTEEWESFAHSV